ncbi:MAG: phosphate starvation-inducible protein PhoH [Deltaproteobacteria bacterium CG07_land_8_20_14_0_80_38_7]|nr:MAG: phosphate starvation-inducible protein PhoH [Deltaproteobacteria bacterium CG07_land_8_20_14_0_80_38_7]
MAKQRKANVTLHFNSDNIIKDLFGPQDVNLSILEEQLGVSIFSRGGTIKIVGDKVAVKACEKVITQFYSVIKKGASVTEDDIRRALTLLSHDSKLKIDNLFSGEIFIPSRKKFVYPKSEGQKKYITAILEHDMTLCIGPAGTGKTYLACAVAISEMLNKKYKRLVLARPAVEAGEKLGFLPGDIAEKVNPYLRPIYDALYDMIDLPQVEKMIAEGTIEIAPIAFMRGRTLNNSFVIIDEAQNATSQQMKMCLTRLGYDSKMVVVGDITQIDLAKDSHSGLVEAWHLLKGIRGMAFHELCEQDIVRHPLVSEIVKSYENRGGDS